MKRTIAIAVAALFSTAALAGGGGPHENDNYITVIPTTSNFSMGGTSSATANATGGLGGAGGAGGTSSALGGAGGSANANGNVSVTGDQNKAYALGMSALTSSANACQGSVSIAFFAFSYTVRFCELVQKSASMQAAGFDRRSVQNLMCLDPDVAQSASECVGSMQK